MAVCSRCGRRLTDPASIALGIGPECRGGKAGGRCARLTAARQQRGLAFRARQPFSVGSLSFAPAGDGADWRVGEGVMPAAQVETYLRCYKLADLDTPLARTIAALYFSHQRLAEAAETMAVGANAEAAAVIWDAAGNVAEGGVLWQPARAYDTRGFVRESGGNWELMVGRRGRVLCRVVAFHRPAVWHPEHVLVEVPAVGRAMCRHEIAWLLAQQANMMVEGVQHG